jgi:hypothetical protein
MDLRVVSQNVLAKRSVVVLLNPIITRYDVTRYLWLHYHIRNGLS